MNNHLMLDIINQYILLDDMWDLLMSAIDYCDRHEYDRAIYMIGKAVTCLDVWYKSCSILPDKTKQILKSSFNKLIECITQIINQPECEYYLDSLLEMLYHLKEMVKITCVVVSLEKNQIKHKA